MRVTSNEGDFVFWAAAAISGVLVANLRLTLNKSLTKGKRINALSIPLSLSLYI